MVLTLTLQWPQWVMLAWVVLVFINAILPPIDRSELVTKFIVWPIIFFVLWAGGFFGMAQAQTPPQANKYRADLVRAAHTQWGLDAPIAALAAQVHQESGWNPAAVSRVGATGMAQFMPATATWWCDLNNMTKADCQPSNPTWALRALVGYDKWLWDRAPARYDAHDRLWVALRAYNGGLGHWLAEAKQTGLQAPTRNQVDAACGRAKRAPIHCTENLGYPARILGMLQLKYSAWGPQV